MLANAWVLFLPAGTCFSPESQVGLLFTRDLNLLMGPSKVVNLKFALSFACRKGGQNALSSSLHLEGENGNIIIFFML